jgi:HSP20 family molecular chaperone IbpA
MLEIQVGPFERLIELPVRVDHADVSAHYDRGILNIRLQKLKEQKQVRKVEIE